MNTLPSLDKTVLCDSSPEDTLVVFPTASLAGAAQTSASDTAASSYGPYKLGKKLGEGGFGSVYEAEQEHPVKRRVAIKIIKLGMDTREVIARFEAERQALAMMQHPNIARVLDVGTSHGRPYFVMELVQGEPISSYCDSHQLSIVQRLQLFDQLCQAVQHAHTKGVIHRDLKPNNVLVSTENEQPLVKVIDFGIAKATSGHLTDHGLLTAQLQMVGTPLYMSPEQAQGSADIDTRTDIYSLGVLLYQLLTDSTPFESSTLRVAQYAEMLHIICVVEPPRPSVRLAQSATTLTDVASKRRIEPRKLIKTVRGELDWIVMKAIEKDRTRRYETANGLAMDVRRYLAGQSVLAAPPSTMYRTRKFVRRYRLAVAAGLLATVALLVGIVSFAWQARIAQQQAHIAQQRADELQLVSKFQADMLGQVDPTRAGQLLSQYVNAKFAQALSKAGVAEVERSAQVEAFAAQWQRVNATDTARELIDNTILKPAAEVIDKQFKDQPLVAASLSQVLADRYVGMGLYDAALPLQERALAIRRRVLGAEHPDSLTSINQMGELLFYQGKPNQAEPYWREALAARRRVLGEAHRDTFLSIGNMGVLLQAQGQPSAAEPYFRETLEKRRRVLGEEHPDTLISLNYMGLVLQTQGKLNAAEPYFREALEKRRRVLGEEHPQTLISIYNLGGLLYAQGKLSEAEPYLREVLEKRRRVLGEEHPDTLTAINFVGALLQAQGKLNEAEPFLRETMEKSRRVRGEQHPNTLVAISFMGTVLQAQGKLDAAEPFLRETMEKSRRVLGEQHPNTLGAIISMASLREAQGQHAEVIAMLGVQEATMRKAFTGGNAFRLGDFLTNIGMARTGLKQFPTAEANLLEAQGIFVVSPGPNPKTARRCIQAIVELYRAWHAAEPSKGYAAKAVEWQRKLSESSAPG